MNADGCDTLNIRVAKHRLRYIGLRYRILLTPHHDLVQGGGGVTPHAPSTEGWNYGLTVFIVENSAHVCSGEEATWSLRHEGRRTVEAVTGAECSYDVRISLCKVT
jgi:hypothetical protein